MRKKSNKNKKKTWEKEKNPKREREIIQTCVTKCKKREFFKGFLNSAKKKKNVRPYKNTKTPRDHPLILWSNSGETPIFPSWPASNSPCWSCKAIKRAWGFFNLPQVFIIFHFFHFAMNICVYVSISMYLCVYVFRLCFPFFRTWPWKSYYFFSSLI